MVMNWILVLAVLAIPCYFAGVQIRELVRAARRGELKCPVRRDKRGQVDYAD